MIKQYMTPCCKRHDLSLYPRTIHIASTAVEVLVVVRRAAFESTLWSTSHALLAGRRECRRTSKNQSPPGKKLWSSS